LRKDKALGHKRQEKEKQGEQGRKEAPEGWGRRRHGRKREDAQGLLLAPVRGDREDRESVRV